MDLGDTVIYRHRRLVVRGIDPAGVEPRLVYLEEEATGRTFSAKYEEPWRTQRTDTSLHLVGSEDGEESA